jgi:glyoxylase-like metal-dependent hydrolase (beta-lactamase superfamily II)
MPRAPLVGITTADAERADYVLIGHSHSDHLWGAERMRRTGATIVGSYETVRLLHDSDSVPETQLIAVADGESPAFFGNTRASLSEPPFVRLGEKLYCPRSQRKLAVLAPAVAHHQRASLLVALAPDGARRNRRRPP